jgi:hypothetical protein
MSRGIISHPMIIGGIMLNNPNKKVILIFFGRFRTDKISFVYHPQ